MINLKRASFVVVTWLALFAPPVYLYNWIAETPMHPLGVMLAGGLAYWAHADVNRWLVIRYGPWSRLVGWVYAIKPTRMKP